MYSTCLFQYFFQRDYNYLAQDIASFEVFAKFRLFPGYFERFSYDSIHMRKPFKHFWKLMLFSGHCKILVRRTIWVGRSCRGSGVEPHWRRTFENLKNSYEICKMLINLDIFQILLNPCVIFSRNEKKRKLLVNCRKILSKMQ